MALSVMRERPLRVSFQVRVGSAFVVRHHAHFENCSQERSGAAGVDFILDGCCYLILADAEDISRRASRSRASGRGISLRSECSFGCETVQDARKDFSGFTVHVYGRIHGYYCMGHWHHHGIWLEVMPNKTLQATAAALCALAVATSHNAAVASASALPTAVPELGR